MDADFDLATLVLPEQGTEAAEVPILMTVVHRFSAAGEAILRCNAHLAGTASIGRISVTAIKVGMLTNGPIGGAGTTTGSGSPRVVSAFRDAPLTTPSNTMSAPQVLSLPQGRWWIVAKAVLLGPENSNIASPIHCLLGAGSPNNLGGDVGDVTATPFGFQGSRAVMGLQMVAQFDSGGGDAFFRCSNQYASHSITWLKMTALKLGKVTLEDLDSPLELNLGSGTPRLRQGISSSGDSFASKHFSTVAELELPAGKWLLSTKASLQGEGGTGSLEVTCRLTFGSEFDQTVSRPTVSSDGMMFNQLTHVSGSTASARLRCKRIGAGWSVTAQFIRFTAMRVGTLTELAI
jgi:hypothetical protein